MNVIFLWLWAKILCLKVFDFFVVSCFCPRGVTHLSQHACSMYLKMSSYVRKGWRWFFPREGSCLTQWGGNSLFSSSAAAALGPLPPRAPWGLIVLDKGVEFMSPVKSGPQSHEIFTNRSSSCLLVMSPCGVGWVHDMLQLLLLCAFLTVSPVNLYISLYSALCVCVWYKCVPKNVSVLMWNAA